MLWATTSCSSRAIRSRSSVTAARTRSRCWSRRDRSASAAAQVATSSATASSKSLRPQVRHPGQRRAREAGDPGAQPEQPVPSAAVGGQREQAQQHEHRQQADVVERPAHHQRAHQEDGVRGHRSRPPPGQRAGGRPRSRPPTGRSGSCSRGSMLLTSVDRCEDSASAGSHDRDQGVHERVDAARQ